MAVKKDIEVNTKVTGTKEVKDLGDKMEETEGKTKSLKTQLREARLDFEKLQNSGKATAKELKEASDKIDDIADKLDRAKFSSGQFEDKLAALPGPLGQIGGGLKSAGDAFATFGTKLTIGLGIIGLLVTAFFAIKDALSKTKEGTQALSAVTSAFNKILAPVLAVFEKLGVYLVKTIVPVLEKVGSVMTWVAEKFGATPEKINEVTASLEKTNEYANKLAEDEKKRQEDAKKAREEKEAADKKAFDARIARLQAQDKLEDSQLEKEKARELDRAKTEQQKLYVEEKFAKLSFDKKKKDLEDLRAQYGKETNEYKDYTSQILSLEANYQTQKTGFRDKQTEINKQKRKDEFEGLKLDLEKQFADGLIKETEYEDKLLVLRDKYAETNLEKQQVAVDKANLLKERRKKAEEEGRQLTFQEIQDEIDAIDALNLAQERDFEDDIMRLEKKKTLLIQQRDAELIAAEKDESKKLEIKRKYGKLLGDVEKGITQTEKAQLEARKELQLAYANAVGSAGKFLQQIAGQNKGLAIAGIVLEQAAAIASIAINASKNFVKDGGVTSPLAWANLAAAGIQAASAVLAAKKGIDAINQVQIPGGAGGASSTAISTPPPIYGGAPTAISTPQIQTQGGANPATQISQTIANAQQMPIRAYVVSGDISSQQALDRKTNRAATFGLG